MTSDSDALMLRVLADELRAHVAALRRLVAAFEADPSRPQAVRDSRQRAHTIAASASLLGDDSLVRTGEVVERTFDLLLAYPADEHLRATLPWCLDDLDYLVGCLAGGEAYAAAARARAAAASERLDQAMSVSGTFAVPPQEATARQDVPRPEGAATVEPATASPSESVADPVWGDGASGGNDLTALDRGLAAPAAVPPSPVVPGGEPAAEDVDLSLLPLDLDAELLETMRAEALGMIATARDQLDILRVSPDDAKALRDLRGSFEAVAGAAELVRSREIAALATASLASVDAAVSASRDAEDVLVLLDLLPPQIDSLEHALLAGLLAATAPEGGTPAARSGGLDGDGPDEPQGAHVEPPLATTGADASARPLPAELEALWEQVELDSADEALLAFDHAPSDEATTPTPAAPAQIAGTDDNGPQIDFTDVDPDVLGIFLDEARGLLAEAATALNRLSARPSREHAETLQRCFHTLKGAAAMIGLDGLSDEARDLEHLIDHTIDGPGGDVATIVPLLTDGARRLSNLLLDGDAEPTTGLAESLAADIEEAKDASDGALDGHERRPSDVADAPDFEADELDDVRALFLEEASELTARLTNAFIALDRSPDDARATAEARRAAHTLKGAAAATGFRAVADLCHAMENLLDGLANGALDASEQTVALLFACGEELDRLVGRVRSDGTDATGASAVPQLTLQILAALDRASERVELAPDETPASLPVVWRDGETTTLDGLPALPTPPLEEDRAGELPVGMPESAQAVRVDIPRLDTLINLVGELVINRSALDQSLARMRRVVQELGGTTGRLRRIETTLSKTYEARELARADSSVSDEFDALEMDRYTELHVLSRELTEMVSDVGTVERELGQILGDLTTTSARQARYSAEIQDRLLGVRLIKLDSVLGRAYRAARELARREGKRVRVRVTGREVEVDTTIVEGLAEAMLHLVRNAVDHGVEASEARIALGKPEVASIACTAAREGNEVVVQVRDDGAGIDAELVFRRAVERGLVDASATLTAQQKLDLVFVQGLSTRDAVSDVSGRGVGLDVVKANVERLHGTVRVESAPGIGTAFIIRLPMTLAITRALLVRAGGRTYAVPVASVTELVRVAPRDVSRIGRQRAVRVRDDVFPLLRLEGLLGARDHEGSRDGDVRVMLARTPRGTVAVAADGFSAQQDIVVKPLPPHLRAARGVTGATILGDGRVVLILDPAQLAGERLDAARADEPRPRPQPSPAPAPRRPAVAGPPIALVVDDSLSIRRIVSKVLEAHGFAVVQAKDGADAAERLQVTRPHVVFLDVEMPRMNGFELLAQIRRSPTLRELPVAMLTSRSGEHHRAKARELGVQAYLTKPSPDAVIVETARRLAGIPATLAGASTSAS